MIFIGTAGDDTLTDAASPGTDDGFFGLAANDLLISNSGRDTLDGDTGFDTADFSGRATSVSVNLVTGQEANSLSSLIGIEGVVASVFGDNITGSGAADDLRGLAGDDVIAA
ncbi:MAG: hypothetical protein K2X49_21360, partial [Acetobacteraceae bacterium]|nr:hypothetical protein [Acetobacteraceae bacterium]